MQEISTWVTLSEAQVLLCVSRKTLYRYLDRKLLSYIKAANGRRYVSKDEIDRFMTSNPANLNNQSITQTQDYSPLVKQISELSDKIDRHNQLLDIMIELYKPETLHQLVVKRKRL